MPKISVIIAAAGSSVRMGGSTPKQYMDIEGCPVLVRTVRAFCGIPEISKILVMCPAGDEAFCEGLVRQHLGRESVKEPVPVISFCAGGAVRQDTVLKGVRLLAQDADHILVHDGARPFVSSRVIAGVIGALLAGADAAVPCVRPKNTIRTAKETLDRSELFEVQTPQGFKAGVLLRACEKALADGFAGTDEASLAERSGCGITITEGDYANIKITTPEDIPMKTPRFGNGYDVHRLVSGRKLMLGCVHVPYEKGLLGHSDADVCAHAIADALLGAAALRDIGYHFPDTAEDTEGMPGSVLLFKTAQLVKNAGFTIVNVDATIVAQRPRLAPYIEEMRKASAAALGIPAGAVSIKATTEEGLGITGTGEAITTFATASIV